MVTDQALPSRSIPALLAGVPAAVGVIVAFIVAIVQYAGIDGGTTKQLTGLDDALGLPSVGASIALFSLFVAWFIGRSAGAIYSHVLHFAALLVGTLTIGFEVAATVLGFSWVALVLLVASLANLLFLILGRGESGEAQVPRTDRRWIFGGMLVVAGVAGLTAAYNLSVDKVTAILHPAVKLNCSYSILVECGTNLKSWQGSLFGFPNPLIGLGGFAVVLVIGIAVLTGARFPRWWWIAFNVGVLLAFAFITFLIYSSVYVIGTLCVWCALVWIVTIPTFWLTTLGNLKDGTFRVGPRATRFFGSAYTWVPIITLVCYLVIFAIYQTQLNLLSSL